MSYMDEVRQGILAMSQKYGYDPLDLGTAISYETVGTFDPRKKGPTTQWGQHKGLFQAGEPQARKYFNNDFGVEPQLEGLHRYFQDTGYKPGMGLMDMYSAINAGGVGRYNASDANNGGAPGTVADKVNNQMGGHRIRARKLLGMPPSQHPSHDPNIGRMPSPGGAPSGAPGGDSQFSVPTGVADELFQLEQSQEKPIGGGGSIPRGGGGGGGGSGGQKGPSRGFADARGSGGDLLKAMSEIMDLSFLKGIA